MGKKIFLSYSRDDSKFVLKLVEDLKRNNFDIWIDQIDMSSGKYWDNSIEQTIGNSCALILIMSPSSAKSENVKDEVSYAKGQKVDIIPILYKEIKDNQMPFRWHRLHFIVMNEKNYDEQIFSLIKNIKGFEKCGFVDDDIDIDPPKKRYFKSIIIGFGLLGIVSVLYFFPSYKTHEKVEQNITKVIDEVNISKKQIEIPPITVVPSIEYKKEIKKEEKVEKKIEPPKKKEHEREKPKPIINFPKPIKKYYKPQPTVTPVNIIDKKQDEKIDDIVCLGQYQNLCNKLKQDRSLKLIMTNHIDETQSEDEAMKELDNINYALRDRGIPRSRIENKIEKDGSSGIRFEFVR